MNNLIIAAFCLSLLLAAWLAWRYFWLLKRLDGYRAQLDQSNAQDISAEHLPVDVQGLEQLSNSIHVLVDHYEKRLTNVDAERARLEATLNQMTDGVLIVDASGSIQMSNPAAENLLGEGQRLVGKTVSVALRHHRLIETWRKCQQLHEMQNDSVELTASHKFFQLIAIPDEHASGSILLIQDLTRIRKLETIRRDFISNVSHELRTPLASLRALTETLQEGALDDPPAAKRFLERMLIEVDALTQMTNELLELSRIESGQLQLERKLTQPIALIRSASSRMALQVERAGLTMELNCAEDLPYIRIDFPRLEQVLVNLIHNAVKFTAPGGTISLAAESDGRFICFAVKDSGVGIPAEDLSRIFERFYRVDRSRAGGGTGLGLSIAKHLVEAHTGKIWAESQEGAGCTVFFTIPL